MSSLAGQAAALASGAMSSVALTRAALDRAAASQPGINAFISIEAEAALAEAAASEARRGSGRALGPLDGVPLAHKDMFDRAGKIATGGTPILAERRAEVDSTVAEKLAAAGCVWVGGLNMSEFAASPTGINIHYGTVRNPHNTDHISGGSSSGSGAAVAAGIVAAALGSDTGGSIRLPASMCGVTGLKPSYGRVSRFGVMPRAPSLDTVGPLARSALDCALLLVAIAGPDPRDPTALDMNVPAVAELLAGGVDRRDQPVDPAVQLSRRARALGPMRRGRGRAAGRAATGWPPVRRFRPPGARSGAAEPLRVAGLTQAIWIGVRSWNQDCACTNPFTAGASARGLRSCATNRNSASSTIRSCSRASSASCAAGSTVV